jgi:hypothetical protein
MNLDVTEVPSTWAPDKVTDERVDAIWKAACQQHPHLHNGRIFAVKDAFAFQITGSFEEYKYLYAQIKEPTIYGKSPLKSLIVTGLTYNKEGLLFALRGKLNSESINEWEIPPSGGLEGPSVDPDAQILKELEEELGLNKKHISKGPVVFSLHESKVKNSFSLCYAIELSVDEATIQDCFSNNASKEYDKLCLIPYAELDNFVEEKTESLYAFSHTLISKGRSLDFIP